jgi:glucose-6-phosphate 1-dehydrogenase
MNGEPITLSVLAGERQGHGVRLGAYERLLGDSMSGDATLFARQDVVEAAWSVVDPVLDNEARPAPYECGSWGPAAADRLVDGIGGWATVDATAAG